MNRVKKYALDVVEGREIAGRYVRLACQRHLNDLKASESVLYLYRFDEDRANDIINFAETLTLTEGKKPQPLILEPFQSFILGSLNGWVTKDKGYRRFRSSYIQLARQNGKSMLNGILAAYYGNFSGYNFGQIYCTATKKEQAKIVFNEIVKFIAADDELAELFNVMDYKSTIECLNTNSLIKALSQDTKRIDGFRPLLGIVDEYHAHPTNQMYKQLEGGTRNLRECLISVITTAGFNLNGPCYFMWKNCKAALDGGHISDSKFVYIAQMDKEDDIWDSRNWIKANPFICKNPENLANLIEVGREAKESADKSDYRDFLTKGLNIWYSAVDGQYLDPENWEACGCSLTLEDFRGCECGLGLDLSSGGDLTSGVLEFPFVGEGVNAYYFHHHSFMPSNRLAEHIKVDKAPYDVWVEEGLITLTETLLGVKTDYKYIISYFRDLIEEYDLKLKVIAYDPHNADAFLSDLEEFGVPCIEIVQSARSLSAATEDFMLSTTGAVKTILYNIKDGLFRFCGLHATKVKNSFGEMKLEKAKREHRIDPLDAAIDVHKVMMLDEVICIPKLTEDYITEFYS